MEGMFTVERITRLPSNFDAFVEEAGAGLARLHGPDAAVTYRRYARSSFRAALSDPQVRAWTVGEGGHVAGLLFAVIRPADTGIPNTPEIPVAQISFLHVLQPYVHTDAAQLLITHAVEDCRAEGAGGILIECVLFCPLRLEPVFTRLGFHVTERLLMHTPLSVPALSMPQIAQSVPLSPKEYDAAAEVIVDAYQGHPGRDLHMEVRAPKPAAEFIASVAQGGFGPASNSYLRAIWRDNRCAAVLLGCEIAPGSGFVLQVAVRRDYQRQGLGAALLRETADAFRRAGLTRVVLGVTRANPAIRLYERMGFEALYPLNVYTWWRNGTIS